MKVYLVHHTEALSAEQESGASSQQAGSRAGRPDRRAAESNRCIAGSYSAQRQAMDHRDCRTGCRCSRSVG